MVSKHRPLGLMQKEKTTLTEGLKTALPPMTTRVLLQAVSQSLKTEMLKYNLIAEINMLAGSKAVLISVATFLCNVYF